MGQPALRFSLPGGLREWLLLLVICVCGFLTQFLLTASLASTGGGRANAATANRATSMQYTAMIFATTSDRIVFGIQLKMASLAGCALIVGSALWATLSKKDVVPPESPRGDVETGASAPVAGEEDEGIRLLSDGEESSEEEDEMDGRHERAR